MIRRTFSCCVKFFVCVPGDVPLTVLSPSQDSAAKPAANKQESELDAEDGRGEDKSQELKSPSRRASQIETKEDVSSVSIQFVIFMLS